MIQIVYEGRQYTHSESGWIGEDNVAVPTIMSTFLSRQAVKDGADPSLFGGNEVLSKKAKQAKVKKRATKKVSILNPKRGISLDSFEAIEKAMEEL